MDNFYQEEIDKVDEFKNILKNIGEQIREKRKAKGLTLENLSEKCGKEWSYLSQIERGRSIPSLKTLIRICNVLEISLTDLFKVHKPPVYKPDPLTKRLVDLLKDSSPKKKEIVYAVVQEILKLK